MKRFLTAVLLMTLTALPITAAHATQIANTGNGRQYTEDSAHSNGDYGTQMLGVRQDSVSVLAGTTGDYLPVSIDANGILRVGGVSATGILKAEDAAHTTADSGVAILGRIDATALTGSSATDEDYGTLNLTTDGRLKIFNEIAATDGVTPFSVLSATATGTTTVTAAATLFNVTVSAQHATTDFWVKLYDKATAATDADTPKQRIFVNAQSTFNVEFPRGLALANGLSIRCVTEAADNGTTAAGSNECTVNGTYK